MLIDYASVSCKVVLEERDMMAVVDMLVHVKDLSGKFS